MGSWRLSDKRICVDILLWLIRLLGEVDLELEGYLDDDVGEEGSQIVDIS